MKIGNLALKVFLLIILNDLGESFAQLLIKKGVIATGIDLISWGNLLEFFFRGAVSPFLILGFVVYVINFFIWLMALSKTDLSIATMMGSVCYILVPLLGIIFLHEKVCLSRWCGVGCIIAGIWFVSRSKQNTPIAP